METSPRAGWSRLSRGDGLPALLLVLAVLWMVAPLLHPDFAASAVVGTDSYRSHDWLEVAKFEFFGRKTLLDHGQLPWWNPLLAGGIPQLTHPSDGSLSPLLLTSLVFGEVLGLKLNVVLALLAGTLGVFFLLRRTISLSRTAAFSGALVYAWAGWLPARMAVGFYEVCLLVAAPAVLALWTLPGDRTARRRRWALAAALTATLALQLQLAVPILVLLMALIVLFRAGQQIATREPLDPSWALSALALLSVAGLLGGIKFVPMLDLLSSAKFRKLAEYPLHPDAWYAGFSQLWYGLWHHVPALPLLDRDGNPRVQEYATLMPGLSALVMAGVGLPVALRRTSPALPFALAGLVFLWLSFGPNAPIDGFLLLFQLPLFGSMRGPLRYANWPVLLGIAVLAGVGVQVLRDRLEPRVGHRVAPALVALVMLGTLPTATDARTLFRSSFLYALEDLPTPDPIVSEGLKGISAGGAHRLNLRKYINVRRGVPTIYDPEDLPMKVGALPAYRLLPKGGTEPELAYAGEAWVSTRDTTRPAMPMGDARLLQYRGAEVDVTWDVTTPATVMLNQNGAAGWRCGEHPVSVGAREKWGLLGLEVEAGAGSATCRWRPPKQGQGIALSLLGLLGLLALWPWSRGGRRTR
ncbi:MAG: hypothetical protein KDA24_26915 [Deltaproteobacteria bacterium]|nr:hypothetical protein [Deltaproteobacteria bacterium]